MPAISAAQPPPRGGDLATATSLHEAAAHFKTQLTPNDVAIERAGQASQQLDIYMASMQGIGILKLFNAEYKRRRLQQRRAVSDFITFAVAMTRLRTALIPLLVTDEHGGKNRPPIGQGVFRSVFG